MPEEFTDKTQRNRDWEKNRRNRLSAAFVELAEVLPSTPKTATKILILQHSVKYIKELKQKNLELLEAKKSHPATISALLDKLSVLEERCSQLIQHIVQQNDGPLVSNIILNTKALPAINDLNLHKNTPTFENIPIEAEKSNKGVSSDESKKEKAHTNADEKTSITPVSTFSSTCEKPEMQEVPLKVTKTPKRIRRKRVKSSAPPSDTVSNILNSDISKASNVWVSSGTNTDPIFVSDIGNMMFPTISKTSRLLVSSNPQPPALYLLQRPLVQNHQNIIKECGFTNALGLIKQNISLINSPGIFNLDITKTTMVNKLPIPTIATTPIAKSCHRPSRLRVSNMAHRILKRTLKKAKKPKANTPVLNKNKENFSKNEKNLNEESPKIISNDKQMESSIHDSSTKSSITVKNSNENITEKIANDDVKSNAKVDSASSTSNNISEKIYDKNVTEHRIHEEKSQENEILKNSSHSNNEKGTNESSDKVSSIQQDKTELELNISKISAKKNLIEEINKVSDERNQLRNHGDTSSNKDSTTENIQIAEKGVVRSDSNKTDKTADIESTKQEMQDISQGSQSSGCNSHLLKNGTNNHIINSNEIPEDLLASFVAPTEQNSSPLAPSPLATSPTAAFLLAFPLVCAGPRPDTPSDNLQTPNICSLDHFSTFFSKDGSVPNNLSIAHTQMFSECFPKPAIQSSPEKNKHGWSESQGQNFNKSTSEAVVNVKTEECSRAVPTNKDSEQKPSVSNASTCVYSHAGYNNSKMANIPNQYSLSDNVFNYEQVNLKHQIQQKQSTYTNKNKLNLDSSCFSMAPDYVNVPSTLAGSNLKSYNYSSVNLQGTDSSCKRNSANEASLKINSVGSELPAVSKNVDISFSFQTQQNKPVFSNSSNIHSSCNTYNPFSSDFSSNSMNLGVSCGNNLNTVRSKPSSGYFPEFSTYSQNSNVWNEENQIEFDSNKADQIRKFSLPLPFNQNITQNISDAQVDFRPTLSSNVKFPTNKQMPTDSKNSKNIKYSGKDPKYSSADKQKSDYLNQKGPVNWMTSDVTAQQNNETFFPNYKEIKSEQGFMLSNSSQSCLDPVPNITSISLNCKKSDLFEQPYFHIQPAGYVSQVVNDENFTWSPSKLAPFAENSLAVPSSLPTLVGDLALGINESKLPYGTNSDQDNLIKDRKNAQKNNSKPVVSQAMDINSSQSGNYFSVSHLMDRGKIVENPEHNKPCGQSNIKRNSTDDNRNFNPHMNPNKSYSSTNVCGNSSNFPSESYSIQPLGNHGLSVTKNNNFNNNNKVDSNITKNTNKNNYSTEALLQNDNNNYQNTRKTKQNAAMQKMYSDNAGYSIHGNQFIPPNHPLPFDNFQNQQYSNNSFPYTSSSVSMNSTFYSSSNFIPTTNMSSTNYMNNVFTGDLNELQNPPENAFFPSKVESCKVKIQNDTRNDFSKYVYTQKITKEANMKNKSEVGNKKDITQPNKRQKKMKNNFSNYAIPERCFSSVTNQVNSPIAMDDSYFGYNSASGQLHQYSSQTGLLPPVQSSSQHLHKINFSAKPNTNTSSPNPGGTSLTNFNLSTIFPEIIKRPNMAVFPDNAHHTSGPISKTTLSGIFH